MSSREVDLFSTRTFTATAALIEENPALSTHHLHDLYNDQKYFDLADHDVSHLPTLQNLQLKLDCELPELPELVSASDDSYHSVVEVDNNVSNDQDVSDIWNHRLILQPASKSGLITWDVSKSKLCGTQSLVTFFEASPDIFNAALAQVCSPSTPLASLDVFVQSLWNLLLGRESVLFRWHDQNQTFVPRASNFSCSGHTSGLTRSLCDDLCQYATQVKQLDLWATANASLSMLASTLRSCLQLALHAVRTHVVAVSTAAHSLLELRSVSRICADLIKPLSLLFHVAQTSSSEQSLLAGFLKTLESLWMANTQLRSFICVIAQYLLDPQIHVFTTIALNQDQNTCRREQTFIAFFDTNSVVIETYAETAECHRRLMVAGRVPESIFDLISSRLLFDWDKILQHNHDVRSSEREIAIDMCSTSHKLVKSHTTSPINQSDDISDPFTLSLDASGWATRQSQFSRQSSGATKTIQDFLTQQAQASTCDISPMQALEHTLIPLLNTQLRLSSYAVFQELFLNHHLVEHLQMLRAFELFGSPSFTMRLSTALFETAVGTATGRKGVANVKGLRLNSRDTWPPTSSEIRLALMTVLPDTTDDQDHVSVIQTLSFAIRDLSKEDMEKCRDIHSIHTLDFLGLTYIPSSPILEAVISDEVLEKYDQVFRYLLQLSRCKVLAQSILAHRLKQGTQPSTTVPDVRLSIELHRYISCLLDYALTVAIHGTWKPFEQRLIHIDQQIRAGNYDKTLQLAVSLAQLRRDHEHILEEIMESLMLAHEQQDMLACVHRTLAVILSMATPVISSRKVSSSRHQYRAAVTDLLRRLDHLSQTDGRAVSIRLSNLRHRIDLLGFYE